MSALLGALSLSTDAANGVRPETALRTAVLAVELARHAALDPPLIHAPYWAALLRFIGCTSFAHETARLAAGDDLAMLASLQTVDGASPRSVLSRALSATSGQPPLARFTATARLLASPSAGHDLASAHCAQAASLASLLGAGPGIHAALADLYERWDGKGHPHGKRGDSSSQAARVIHVAAWAEAHDATAGAERALDAVASMAGRSLDPGLAAVFAQCGASLLARVARRAFEHAVELEPEPRSTRDPAATEPVFVAFARYADLKSPFTLGHSEQVATLADRCARALGLRDDERIRLRHTALLHDLGRVAVPSGIWDSTQPLGLHEREQIRSHALHTERVLGFAEATRPLALLAAGAHEREDESGYPHSRAPRSVAARLLAACDVASALREARPHRPARSVDECERVLRDEVRARRLDATAVDCAVNALRGRDTLPRAEGALSEREIEVLAQLARGSSNKEIASALGISAKTVQHHVAHVYEKTGVRSRAAAALYAVERGLLVGRA